MTARVANPYPGMPSHRGMAVAEARAARQAYQRESEKVRRQYPELGLRIHATPVGVRLVLTMTRAWLPPGDQVECLTEAVWAPREVTEEAVVDWGRRALARWLEGRVVAAEAVLGSAE